MRIFLKITYLFLIALLILLSESVYAQCDPNLHPEQSSRGYQSLSNNRCEGFYVSDVSSGNLDVVGVTQGVFKFKLDPSEILSVSSPIVTDKSVNVRAVGIPLKMYYRMDAQIAANSSLQWPVGDFLYKNNLNSEKIGIYGWVGNNNIYVPVKVTSNTLPEPGNTVYVYFRSSVDIKNVKWRFADVLPDGTREKASEWKYPNKTVYNSGNSIICRVPEDKKSMVWVNVRADSQDGGQQLSCEAKITLH